MGREAVGVGAVVGVAVGAAVGGTAVEVAGTEVDVGGAAVVGLGPGAPQPETRARRLISKPAVAPGFRFTMQASSCRPWEMKNQWIGHSSTGPEKVDRDLGTITE
ncbi:MAG TPA: hypothetical protein VLL49_01200 [Anaerolineales bacterium]|nr:hypothetical protein [Anaerolineales bacterium]